MVTAGRNARTKQAERALRQSVAVFGLAVWVLCNAAWNWRGIDIDQGLPLQLCDVAGIVAPLVLLTLNPWLRAALYFWACVLTQAFIQPTVTQGLAGPIPDANMRSAPSIWPSSFRSTRCWGRTTSTSATHRPTAPFRPSSPCSGRGRAARSSWSPWPGFALALLPWVRLRARSTGDVLPGNS